MHCWNCSRNLFERARLFNKFKVVKAVQTWPQTTKVDLIFVQFYFDCNPLHLINTRAELPPWACPLSPGWTAPGESTSVRSPLATGQQWARASFHFQNTINTGKLTPPPTWHTQPTRGVHYFGNFFQTQQISQIEKFWIIILFSHRRVWNNPSIKIHSFGGKLVISRLVWFPS